MIKLHNRGFTIIELLIATAVLSFILLLSTVMITGIGNLFYKGINQSRAQNNARSIIKQMSQDIQLSSSTPSHGTATVGGKTVEVICAGAIRYTYVVGYKINTNGFKHILWRDTPAGGCVANAGANITANVPSDGSELIGVNSRLTKLNFPAMTSNLQTINLGVAVGDDDMLTTTNPVRCKGDNSTQYCATADLDTVVVQRITSN